MVDVTNDHPVGAAAAATDATPGVNGSAGAWAPTLAGVAVGSRATVRTFRCAAPLMQRLLEMGLTRGTEVEVIRVAPLGDPMEIRLRGYYLSLRKAEAGLIEIDAEPRP